MTQFDNPPVNRESSILADRDKRTAWDWLTLLFWAVFFAIGLTPELVFYGLRDLAAVASRTALINSSAVITIGLALFLAYFVYHRCRDAGLSHGQSQGRTLQTGLFGLLAFLDIPSPGAAFEVQTLVAVAIASSGIAEMPPLLRGVVIGSAIIKFGAWLYLYSLVIRYHLFANRTVFATMPNFFGVGRPSGQGKDLSRNHSVEGAIDPPDGIIADDLNDVSRN